MFGNLAFEGGFVPAMPVGGGSPAIGAVSETPELVETDARKTPQKSPCRVGAFEYTCGEAYENVFCFVAWRSTNFIG